MFNIHKCTTMNGSKGTKFNLTFRYEQNIGTDEWCHHRLEALVYGQKLSRISQDVWKDLNLVLFSF